MFPIIIIKYTKRESSQNVGQTLVIKYIYMTANIIKI